MFLFSMTKSASAIESCSAYNGLFNGFKNDISSKVITSARAKYSTDFKNVSGIWNAADVAYLV
ncbi:MAG: hypothetical protein ICV51_22210 [Flavisolibacter sp.]|nr:hypothetical protein [Flavisolibacter sp.]